MVIVSLLTVIVPLPNGLDKWLFLTTFPSGMILQVGTNSVPQAAAFEASRHPKGVGRGLCSRKDAVQLEEKLFWCLLGSLEVLDNVTIVPIVFQNFPKYPHSGGVFFTPPSGLVRPAIRGSTYAPRYLQDYGVDRHHLRKTSNSCSPHQNEKMTHTRAPVLTVCCRGICQKKDEWNMDFFTWLIWSQL